MTRNLTGFVLAMVAGSLAVAQEKNPWDLVAEANRAFANGEYHAALEGYAAAAVALPQSPQIAYNQGVALYKLGDYTQAREAFNRAMVTENTKLEEMAKFNLGNVAYAEALKNRANPGEAVRLLKTAIGHYQDAFELDPNDDDAQANTELAMRLIKNLLDAAKPPQRGEQQQNREGSPEDENGKPSGQPQPDRQPADDQLPSDDQQQQGSPLETTEEMTHGEAMKLLQLVRDKERRRHEQLIRRRRAERTPVLKDW